jgi:hypothetical protein
MLLKSGISEGIFAFFNMVLKNCTNSVVPFGIRENFCFQKKFSLYEQGFPQVRAAVENRKNQVDF